ncbi:hypothetical protein AOLI_G00215830 [Acnodon oligacanthus]
MPKKEQESGLSHSSKRAVVESIMRYLHCLKSGRGKCFIVTVFFNKVKIFILLLKTGRHSGFVSAGFQSSQAVGRELHSGAPCASGLGDKPSATNATAVPLGV